MGRDQNVLQIIRVNTLVDVIRVAKTRTSCEYLPIDTNFVSILLLVFCTFFADFLVHTLKLKPIIKAQISGKLVTSDVATASVHSEKTHLKKLIMISIIMNNRKTIY